MALNFFSISSGSSGNSAYLGTPGEYGILIDAGISSSKISNALLTHGIHPSEIWGILITHEHSDHIKGAHKIAEELSVPLFMHECTFHNIVTKNPNLLSGVYVRTFLSYEHIPIRDFTIEPFPLTHDVPCFGFSISRSGSNFVTATDFGEVSSTLTSYAKKADYLLIEGNYDEQLLATSSYPAFLRARIASPEGHISNSTLAAFLRPLTARHVFVGHISHINNSPDAVRHALNDTPLNYTLLSDSPSEMFALSNQ